MGKRGRPKGRTVAKEDKKWSVIIDPIIAPYKIIFDDCSYTLVEESKSEVKEVEDKKIQTDEIVHGYFTSLGNALWKIAKLKVSRSKKKQFTLPEYVKELETLIKGFKEKLIFEDKPKIDPSKVIIKSPVLIKENKINEIK